MALCIDGLPLVAPAGRDPGPIMQFGFAECQAIFRNKCVTNIGFLKFGARTRSGLEVRGSARSGPIPDALTIRRFYERCEPLAHGDPDAITNAIACAKVLEPVTSRVDRARRQSNLRCFPVRSAVACQPNATSNAIAYAKFFSRSPHDVNG
jgi:hypothetical protein